MAGPLTLGEAKKFLNITSASDDEEIGRFLEASTDLVESLVGPLTVRMIVDEPATVSPGTGTIMLRTAPVVGVDSITARGSGVVLFVAADLYVDQSTGVVTALSGGHLRGGHLLVTYRAGRADVPEAIRLAQGIVLDHLWRTQRAQRPSARGGSPEAAPPMGFALPARAEQLLQPYRVPRVA